MADAPQADAPPADPHAECQRQLVDLEAKWKRAVADYANREKELAREREDFAKFCTVDLIRDFLPIVDAAEAASRPHPPTPPLPAGGEETETNFSPSRGEGEREGVVAIRQLCLDLLKRHGVEPFGAVGDRVDYLLHEVVGMRSEEGKDAGSILEVVQVGYTMHGRLLRPAKVIIQGEMKNEEKGFSPSPRWGEGE